MNGPPNSSPAPSKPHQGEARVPAPASSKGLTAGLTETNTAASHTQDNSDEIGEGKGSESVTR